MNPTNRANRFQAGIPAELHYEGKDFPCVGKSVSRTGVLLEGHIPWPADAEVEVTLRTPGGDLQFDGTGRVVHVFHTDDDGAIRLGLEFERLTAAQRAALESLVNRVMEAVSPAPLEMLPRGAPLSRVRAALESIPLPHRIMLAQRAQLKERGFLREDTSLQVLEGLARNPNISLLEIKILTRKPQLLPTTIEIIAKDLRWAKEEELNIILATHPRTSIMIAEEVVSRMSDRSLKKVIRSPGLNPLLRTKLLARFTGRELSGW